jgi:hypothetical protein
MRTHFLVFLLGLGVFAGFAGPRLTIHSADNHFVYLADAFLKGQVELTRPPPHANDWASYDIQQLKGATAASHGESVKGFFTGRTGKPNEFRTLQGEHLEIPAADRGKKEVRHFVSFPPLPAVLLMPVVALVGYGANDVIFTLLFAALNGVLFFGLLELLRRRGYTKRSVTENLWLTAIFALGTNHLWCAVRGQVWFTALIIGLTFHLAYVYFALDARRPFWAGVMLACGFATRAPLVFAAVFFYWQLLRPASGERFERKVLIQKFVQFSAPCIAVGLSLLLYNYARFERFSEFGHIYLAGGRMSRIRDYGLFHPYFISRNLHAMLTLTPRFSMNSFQISKHGMSLFLTTPVFAWLFWPRTRNALTRCAAWCTAVMLVPILLYQNTGWAQFGFRFALDFTPYLVLLLAVGAVPISRTFKTLAVVGMLVNAFGAATFQRKIGEKIYAEFDCPEPPR